MWFIIRRVEPETFRVRPHNVRLRMLDQIPHVEPQHLVRGVL